MGLTLGGPLSCFSDQGCNFSLASDVDLLVSQVQFIFDNPITSGNLSIFFNFSVPFNLHNGFSTPIIFNNQPGIAQSNLLPPICGDGDQVQVRGVAIPASGGLENSPSLNMTLVRSPCICTQISDVFTTLDALSGCVGIDGTIGLQGKLFEVTCSGGIPSPFVNQGPVVSIGLEDPATGIFYEYVRASTDGTGTFSVGFGIKNRADVAALIPAGGSKDLNLQIQYVGSTTHSRSSVFSLGVSVRGNQGPTCNLGTLILDQTFGTATPAETLHEITGSFTGKILSLSDHDRAVDIANRVHDSIVSSGATPIEIKVFRGPDIPLPIFFGFGSVSAPGFNVVATAIGSPVAIALIAAAILAIIIILAIFVIALWFIDKIVSAPGGAAALIAIAVGVTAVAGVGLYVLTRPRARRLLA